MVAEITSYDEFKELIEKDVVTVVDFYATWCGPCKQIAPFIEKLEKENSEGKFVKVDVDELSDIAGEFSVRAMPTFMIFRNGEKVSEVVGANPAALKAAVTSQLKAWLAGEPVVPVGQPPQNDALDFVNKYGRIIVIFIGFLIWYMRRESTTTATEEFPDL